MALSRDLGRESAGTMPRSDPSFFSELPESFFQLQIQLQYEAKDRFGQIQYETEMEKDYWRNRAGKALAARSARMLRDLECSILKPHNNSKEEKPWTIVSGHGGFGETSQLYCANKICHAIGVCICGHPNLAGSSSGFHFQQQEISGGEAVRIGISDEYDDHIPCGASNSSAFGQDTALPLYHNQPNPSNGDAIMEIREEGNNLSGNPWVPKLGSGETNVAVASSPGINNLAGSSSGGEEAMRIGISDEYDDHIPCGASNSSAFGQDTVLPLYHKQPNPSNGVAKFRPEVNTLFAGITGQAIVNLISSSSTHEFTYVRVFAASSGIGFLGSFFAIHLLKKPKLAEVLSKIGAIGTGSSVIIALGMNVLEDANWYLKVVGLGAIAAGCLISTVAVVMAD